MPGERGLAALEVAILMPVFLIIIFTMFQIALHWHAANVVGVAAEQAVNAGQVEEAGQAEPAARAAAASILGTASFRGDPAVDVTFPTPDLIRVEITAETPRLIWLGAWRTQTVAQGRIEEFVPADER